MDVDLATETLYVTDPTLTPDLLSRVMDDDLAEMVLAPDADLHSIAAVARDLIVESYI